jgi:hypothetical protein
MLSCPEFESFLATGLALDGVYALSAVGLVVLDRARSVLNLAFGAVGAFGALIAWQPTNSAEANQRVAYLVAVLVGGMMTIVYGSTFASLLAGCPAGHGGQPGLDVDSAWGDGPAVDLSAGARDNTRSASRRVPVIKDTLDPNGILAAGKQRIWPARLPNAATS